MWALACRTMSFHFFPICHQLSPSSHSQHWKISFYLLFVSFSGSSPSSRPFQLLSEDLFRHPIVLHSGNIYIYIYIYICIHFLCDRVTCHLLQCVLCRPIVHIFAHSQRPLLNTTSFARFLQVSVITSKPNL